jgi:transposase-like protein
MEKKKGRQYSLGFKEQAIQRMQEGERVKALERELEMSRSTLFSWKREAAGRPDRAKREQAKAPTAGETAALEVRIRELEATLGRKTMETDFFQSALRRLAESGPATGNSGEKSSRRKSAAGWNRKAD